MPEVTIFSDQIKIIASAFGKSPTSPKIFIYHRSPSHDSITAVESVKIAFDCQVFNLSSGSVDRSPYLIDHLF